MALQVNDSNFQEVVLESKQPVMVDFWATWCGPCKALSPVIDEIAQEYEGKVVVAKCNVDEASDAPMKYGIRNIPTLLFFVNGEVKHKIVGTVAKSSIVSELEKFL